MKPLVICLLILHTIGHVTMTSSVTVADSSSSSEVMSSSETITTEDPTTESTPPSGSASDVVYTMLFVLDTNIYENATNETLNNANSTEYKAIERGLDDFWKTKLGDLLVNVTIVLIRKGSLIVDHAVQTKTESTGKVLTAAIDLVNGASNVNIGTESVSAISSNVTTSSGTTVQIDKASNPNVCDLYTTLAPCTPLQTCKISNGQPSCVNLNVSQQDNLPVIILIGGVLLILTLPLIFVLLDMHKKRKDRRESKSNSGSPINHEIPMGLTCNSIKGGPDFNNPAFTGSDAGSENPQGGGHLEGQNELQIPHIDYNYRGKR